MAIPGGQVTTLGGFQEQLASFPDVTKRKNLGDGTEPGGTGQAPQQPGGGPVPADDQTPASEILQNVGPTLRDVEPNVKHTVNEQLWRSQDRLGKNRWAIDVHFRRIRSNIPFARLDKIPNQGIWVAKVPNGMSKEAAAAVPCKCDDLCNKIEDTLMADPPKPAPTSHVDDTSAKAAAELAKSVLNQINGATGTNEVAAYRWALSNAFTGSSSFIHYRLDRTGGGNQPLQKLAHPLAQDPANPLVAMVPDPSGVPDPLTGQPAMMEERTSNPILRYVGPPTPDAPAGQFVQDASQADREWLPGIVLDRLRREQVRVFPPTASVKDAAAVELLLWCSLADARAMWPKTVGQMSQEDLLGLASWTPAMAPDMIVPYAFRGSLSAGGTGPSLDEVGSFSPLLQRRMFYYCLYIKDSPEYPGGYYSVTNGFKGGLVLADGDMEYVVKLPVSGTTKRARDIPVVQVTPMKDIDGGDPMGWPLSSRFAGTSEATANLLAAFADVCDNMVHAHVFLRSTATVDEDDWADRLTPIVLNPGDPEPTYERFPTLPPIIELVDKLDKAADTISGLTATAQGLDTANSKSGVAKNLDVRQALISMSGFQQDLIAGMCRGWRIELQMMQAFFTSRQMLQATGEEGSGAVEWWSAEDLASVDDRVGLQPGTGTMMTPEGKAQYVAFLQGQGWKTPEEAAEIALPGIASDLGVPQDPYKAAIERSVDQFLKGPPAGWLDARNAYTQEVAGLQAQYQAQTAPALAMGQPVQPFTPPPAPGMDPFPTRPNDGEPAVATIYQKRLSKMFMDPQYAAQDPAWQQTAIGCYQRAVAAIQAVQQAAQVQADALLHQNPKKQAEGLLDGSPPTEGVTKPAQPQQPHAAPVQAGPPVQHPPKPFGG